MRELTEHIVEGDSANQLKVAVADEPGQGGACHRYVIFGFDIATNPSKDDGSYDDCEILFQNGPIKEAGVNGITHEVLLAILIDRMRSFQAGPYACIDNQIALTSLEEALRQLQRRTKARIARGVEGTHEK